MARFLKNPVYSIETGELLSHDGVSFETPEILFDRSVQKGAKNLSTSATGTAGNLGTQASQIGSTIIPGLETEATHPTGYTPEQLNSQRVASQQGLGGAASGITGQANLEAARTRNAGGFAAALAEAARSKGRQSSQNEVELQARNADLAQKKQQMAQSQLAGLYGTDLTGQLKSMGLANEDLNTELAGGRQGWLQNAEGVINTLKGSKGPAAYI
jgi:hypothetical protein